MWSEYLMPGAKAATVYAEKLLTGITPEDFARKPKVGDVVVEMNHPAFVYGHLSVYPALIAELLELNIEGIAPTSAYRELFQKGAVCSDDVEGTIYQPMTEITEFYFRTHEALFPRLSEVKTDVLHKPLADPDRRSRFGTVGAFASYVLLAHPQVHLGQLSSWRRCMGLGAV